MNDIDIDVLRTLLNDHSADEITSTLAELDATMKKEKEKNKKLSNIDTFRNTIMTTWNERRNDGKSIDETDVAAIMMHYFADGLDDMDEAVEMMDELSGKIKDSKKALMRLHVLCDSLGKALDKEVPVNKSKVNDEDIINAFLKMLD